MFYEIIIYNTVEHYHERLSVLTMVEKTFQV